jgi:hypothetical protein
MNKKMKIAFACHFLALLFMIAGGLIYLLRTQFMPYHAIAAGKSWEQIEPNIRILFLAFMRD